MFIRGLLLAMRKRQLDTKTRFPRDWNAHGRQMIGGNLEEWGVGRVFPKENGRIVKAKSEVRQIFVLSCEGIHSPDFA